MAAIRDKSALIVDSNEHFCAIMRTIMPHLGYGIITEACTHEQALDILLTHDPQVILIERHTRNANGLDLARAIRQMRTPERFRTPILLTTAFGDEQLILDARDAGINFVVAKPVSISQLARSLTIATDPSRPFIDSLDYVGPCRRRRKDAPADGVWKRRTDDDKAREAVARAMAARRA